MKLAFVSGGSRGLGKEVASALVKQGHQVVIIGKDPNRASTTASKIGCEFENADQIWGSTSSCFGSWCYE